MKIAFIMPDDFSITLFAKGILRALGELKGSEVTAICALGDYGGEIEALGVKTLHVDTYRFFHPLRDLRYLLTLFTLLKKNRFEVVFTFSTKPNIFGTIAARLAGVKKVVSHVVGLGAAFSSEKSAASLLLSEAFLALYRLSCAWSDKVWFTNRNDLNFFYSRGIITPEKAVLTRNYLDTDLYSPTAVDPARVTALKDELGVAVGDRVVVMVARMVWAKGIREFAEAAVLLRDQCPRVKFFLIAPLEQGSFDAVPESYIRDLEKQANLRWLGFRSDVKEIYALCDLAVLPSYYKEGGYPRALLEPMSFGKPLIATLSEDCRGPVDEGRNGYLVPIKDSRALAQAIAAIIDDDELLRRLGRHSREKAVNEFEERRIVPQALAACGLPVVAA